MLNNILISVSLFTFNEDCYMIIIISDTIIYIINFNRRVQYMMGRAIIIVLFIVYTTLKR